MKCRLLLILLSLLSAAAPGLGAETWHIYRNVAAYSQYALLGDYVYIQAGQTLLRMPRLDWQDPLAPPSAEVMDQAAAALQTMSSKEGLSGNFVFGIAYSQMADVLAVVYTDGLIDLIDADGDIASFDDYERYAAAGWDKTITGVTMADGMLYLACGFGFVQFDVRERLFRLTCRTSSPCTRAFHCGSMLYRSTIDGGLEQMPLGKPAHQAASWTPVGITTLADVRVSADSCQAIDTRGQLFTLYADGTVSDRTSTTRGTLQTPEEAQVLSSLPAYQELGCSTACLMHARNGILTVAQSNIYHTTYNLNTDGVISRFDSHTGLWHNTTTRQWVEQVGNRAQGFRGIISMTPHPSIDSVYYLGMAGSCLIKIAGDKIGQHYLPDNSPVRYVRGYEQDLYGRVGGTAFDADGNLWMVNAFTSQPLRCLTPDGQWYGLAFPELGNINMPTHLVYSDHSGFLYCMDEHARRLFWYDPGRTPAITADDRYDTFDLVDSDGVFYKPTYITNLYEDYRHRIWILTTSGPFVIDDQQAWADDARHTVSRLRLASSDSLVGGSYLLWGHHCQCIVSDALDRLWIGTLDDGLYLVSADGSEVLRHFTTSNSPLLGNSICALALDDSDGTLYVATEGGVVAYRDEKDPTPPDVETYDDFAACVVYPNPVRPDYTGPLHIDRLPAGTHLRIVDSTMHPVYDGIVGGPTFSWSLTTDSGRRVRPGVYLIYAEAEGEDLRLIARILVTG